MRVRFAEFTLDPETRQLRRGGDELRLSRKAFDLLLFLVDRRPGVVDKETLRDKLWGQTSVVDANLNNLASEIRTVLGDDAQQPRFLRTVHRVGYAFCGEATVEGGDAAIERPSGDRLARCWFVWHDRTFALSAERAVIGRDPETDIWIDAPGVSRRHAAVRLVADGDRTTAVLEDLGSTNGTFVARRRVTGPVTLEEGDPVEVGEATLTFRTGSAANAPTRRIGRRRS
jgi:DNA-binding winged helix-turn-helix (wHTH) protein